MDDSIKDNTAKGLNRRDLIKSGLLLAGAAMLPFQGKVSANSISKERTDKKLSGKRKLGKLEVSAIGLGVQNMSRTYQQFLHGPK